MNVSDDVYLINGKKYVRVTKVLGIIATPEFYRWFGKHGYDECKKIMETRASFGTRVHKEIQNYFEGKQVWVDNEEMRKNLALFMSWASNHSWNPMFLEYTVRDDDYMFAGTVDYIGGFDDKLLLMDWKTSKKIHDNHYLQVSAYLVAFEKMSGMVLDGCKIVCIRDGGLSSNMISRSRAYELFDVFRCARKIYNWKYGV